METAYRPTAADVDRAGRIAAELAERREVVVVRAGWGGGWYVTSVDPVAFTFELRRDGASVEVSWAEVLD